VQKRGPRINAKGKSGPKNQPGPGTHKIRREIKKMREWGGEGKAAVFLKILWCRKEEKEKGHQAPNPTFRVLERGAL